MKDQITDRRGFLNQIAAGAVAMSAAGHRRGTEAWRIATTGEARWQAVRDQFLLEPGYTYMNTAGLGPTPEPVLVAMSETSHRLEARSETGHGEVEGVREKAASFLGCGVDELAFTRNATEGMNLVARGLELAPGDEVLMTTHEHPGGAMPWFGVREDVAVRIRTIDPGSGGSDTMERVRQALTARTRVVMVSHILCTTGTELPIPEIAGLCRERDVVSVIDGAQCPGQIPVDLHALGCDFYVASGHKWLLGPKGSGFLFVKEEWLDRWRPSYVGAYSDAGLDLAAGTFTRLRPASASEYGTRSTPLLRGFEAAFDFLDTLGVEAVAERGASLARRLREGVAEIPAAEILTPAEHCAAILTFRLPESGGNAWDWVNRIRQDHGIRLRPVGEAGLNGVRASPHLFNSEAEVDRVVEVLGDLV